MKSASEKCCDFFFEGRMKIKIYSVSKHFIHLSTLTALFLILISTFDFSPASLSSASSDKSGSNRRKLAGDWERDGNES
jgi:hypothetical protein